MGGNLGGSSSNNSNDVWYSSDGANWTNAPGTPWSARRGFGCVVFDNKIWVIVGQCCFVADVWYSPDGANWYQASSNTWGAHKACTSVIFRNKIYVMGGDFGNSVWYSNSDIWVP